MEQNEKVALGSNLEQLEPVEIDVRAPSLVLSVRLDEATAKQLHAVARRRGVRISDVLRDAAVSYASAPWDRTTPYVISYARVDRFAVGLQAVGSQGRSNPQESAERTSAGAGWEVGVKTMVTAVG